MAEQVGHILKNEESGALGPEDAYDVVDQIAVFAAVEAFLLAGVGKRLAGEAGAEDVVVGDFLETDIVDVARCPHAEVRLIQPVQLRIDFAGENAFVSQRSERQMKASQASEQIDELH